MADNADAIKLPQPSENLRRLCVIVLVSLLGPSAVLGGGLYVYVNGGRFVSTDNANIKSNKIAISADVSGRVVQVSVRANDAVEAGQLLFRLDPEPFKITLDKNDAYLATQRHEVEALRALHSQKLAERQLEKGDIAYYEREFERRQLLGQKGFASQANLDTAAKNVRNARERFNAVNQDIAQVLARLGGNPNNHTEKHPRVREARAARDRAALDLRRTKVRVPTAGIVTNFDLQTGEYIEQGDPVFSVIGTRDVWVQANFKETDLTHVRVGQQARVRIDTYPDARLQAVVSSISPATGAEFALLPPQNATGNWVKVVQRLPVRLLLENQTTALPLRAGMSVIVEIDTGHKRSWSDVMTVAMSWIEGLI